MQVRFLHLIPSFAKHINHTMRKKPRSVEEYSSCIDDCLAPILELAKKKFGDDKVYTGKESEARLVGIALPALSLRYLFQMNILPLSRMMQITGLQESCKSAFLYEIYRWFRCNEGRAYHIENESKDSDTLRTSILNYDRGAVSLLVSESLEEWQKQISFLLHPKHGVKAGLTGAKDKPGPGKTVPLAFGVDSLMSKASEETLDNIEAQGYTDRAHPVEALKISSYLKFIPQRLTGWPFMFIATNHLKPHKGSTGAIEYNIPGGFSVRFQETFEIRMARVADIKGVETQGVTIRFTTAKNSLGPSRKTMTADMKWYLDKDDAYRQKTFWDWDGATISLLDDFKGSLRSDISDICDLHTAVVPGKGKRVWSNALGITKDDPVPYSTAGAILEAKPELTSRLHKILGVREYCVFKPGVSYSQQLATANAAIEIAEGYAPEHQNGEPVEPEEV